MPIDKSNILRELEALKIVNSNGFPKIRNILKNDFKNYKTNPLEFTLGLVKILLGWERLKDEVINFLTFSLPNIEGAVKIALKNLYKQTFNCSTNSIIPVSFINTGFLIEIKDIDFFNFFKINPNTNTGSFFYGGENLDLNRVIYDTINSGQANWQDLLILKYYETGVINGELKSDILNIKINPLWTNKKINSFLNELIDSISLFRIDFVVNNALNFLFGNLNSSLGISLSSIRKQEELKLLIEKVISIEDEIVDDSYFDFSNNEIDIINRNIQNSSKGIRKIVSCGGVDAIIDNSTVNSLNNQLQITSSKIEIKNVLDGNFTILEQDYSNNLNNNNKRIGFFELYLSFFKNILFSLVFQLFSPKMILLFKLYGKIVNNSIGYTGFKDFLSKHKDFVVNLIRNILLPILLNFLLEIIIKEIRDILIADKVNKVKEKTKNYRYQFFSLLGVPNEITSILNRL